MTIRGPSPGDEAAWRDLWAAYLAFYGVTLLPEVTESTWRRILEPESPLEARLAFEGDEMAGFVLHHPHLTTWATRTDRYLEDLFMRPASRGRGVGRALIDDLVALARSEGDGRVYWLTDERNTVARALYDSVVETDRHVRYRLSL